MDSHYNAFCSNFYTLGRTTVALHLLNTNIIVARETQLVKFSDIYKVLKFLKINISRKFATSEKSSYISSKKTFLHITHMNVLGTKI